MIRARPPARSGKGNGKIRSVLIAFGILASPGFAQTLPEEFRGVPKAQYPIGLVPKAQRPEWDKKWQVDLERRRNLDWCGGVENWDDARAYLSAILDTLLSDRPDLRRQVQADIFSVPWVNAEELLDGTMLVDLGLLGRLQDESQLAMVLAHEVAHAQLNHGMLRWLDGRFADSRAEYGRRVWNPSTDTHSLRLAASRTREAQADSVGFLLFSRTRYGSSSLDTLFPLLGHPVSVGGRRWDRTALRGVSDPGFPDSIWAGEGQVAPATEIESDTTDHPAPHRRREALARWKTGRRTDGPGFLVDKAFFFRLRERARQALPARLLESNQPAQALFESWSRLSESDSIPARRTFSRALADLALAVSGSRRWAPSVRSLPTGGEFWTLDRFLRRVDGLDLSVFALEENRRLLRDGLGQALDSSLQKEIWISMETGWPRLCQSVRDSVSPLPRVERRNLARIQKLRHILSPMPAGPWVADRNLAPRPLAGRTVLALPPDWGEQPGTTKFGSRIVARDSLVRFLKSALGVPGTQILVPDPAAWTGDSLAPVLALAQVQGWMRSRFDPRGAERWRPRLSLLSQTLRRWNADAVLVVSLDQRKGSPNPEKWWQSNADDGEEIGLRATWFDASTGALGRASSLSLPEDPSPSDLREAVQKLSTYLLKVPAIPEGE